MPVVYRPHPKEVVPVDLIIFYPDPQLVRFGYRAARTEPDIGTGADFRRHDREALLQVGLDLIDIHTRVDEQLVAGRFRCSRRVVIGISRVGVLIAAVAYESGESNKGTAKHVVSGVRLAAYGQLIQRPRIAQGEFGKMAIRKDAVVLIHQVPDLLFEIAPEVWLPAYAQHLAARTDAVVEHALVGAPLARHEPVIGHAIQESTVGVPRILPLRYFIGHVEIAPQHRKIDARGEPRLAEQVAAAV